MRSDPVRGGGVAPSDASFVLYVEGPRDRDLLRAWSFRLLPSWARRLFRSSVILGGRRPARAIEHFRGLGGEAGGTRALCVLDRDDDSATRERPELEPGLQLFTWTRRHVESYLLVPDAINRALRLPAEDGRAARMLREQLGGDGEDAYRGVDAKRLLAPTGALSQLLGAPIPLRRVAESTRVDELHADVIDLFAHLRRELGVEADAPDA